MNGNLCVVIFAILPCLSLVKGECNVCHDPTNIACISDTEFKQCDGNGIPFGIVNQCNPGTYCSIVGTCATDAELAECQDCGKCNSEKIFACTGTQTFALCLGTNETSDIVSHCTGDYVCNVQYPDICVLDAPATCSYKDDPTEAPTTVPTTTTPSPLNNPTAFCEGVGNEGRYPVGTNAATTCHKYISCQEIGGKWYGPIYTCPGNTYYDSAKRVCVSTVPATCTARVAGLSFRSITLE